MSNASGNFDDDQSTTEHNELNISDEASNDDQSSTLGPTPKVKTLSDLTSAITNAFGENPERSAQTQKDKITAAIEKNNGTKLLDNPDKCENALFGNGGALNYSFDSYWESVAPKDTSGSPIAQPTETQYVHRFKTGQEPRQADAGFETWKNQNQEWTQAFKAHHTLLSTAKDVIHTSRSVKNLLPSDADNGKQARAKHRELIQRTNKVVEAGVSAKYLASAYDRSAQTTHWARNMWKTMQARKETGASTEKNRADLLSMPCTNEEEALKLLEKSNDIMENAFKDMGLTPLPNGGYRLPPTLNNTKGINHVLKAMSAKSGGYRTYSVSMGGEMRIKNPASIIEQAIDSHFEEGGTPYAVETSGKKSSGEKYETAMQWLKSEMDKPVNDNQKDSPKLKDCTPTARAQVIAAKLDEKIENAAGKRTPADKIVLKCLQRHQVKALSRTKFAEQQLENAKDMQAQVQNVFEKTPGPPPPKDLMQNHLNDLHEYVNTLDKTHEDLKGQEQTIKDKITKGNNDIKELKGQLENKENTGSVSDPNAPRPIQTADEIKNQITETQKDIAQAKNELAQHRNANNPERYRAKEIKKATNRLEKAVKEEERATEKLTEATKKKSKNIPQYKEKLASAKEETDDAKDNLKNVEVETRTYVEACNTNNGNIVSSVLENPQMIMLEPGDQNNHYDDWRNNVGNTHKYEWKENNDGTYSNSESENSNDPLRDKVQEQYNKLTKQVDEIRERANDITNPKSIEMQDQGANDTNQNDLPKGWSSMTTQM